MPSVLDELRQMNVKSQRKNAEPDATQTGANNPDITSNTVSQSYDLLTDKPTDRQADQPVSPSDGGQTVLPTDQQTDLSGSRPVGQTGRQLSDRSAERQPDKSASRPPDIKGRLKELAASSMTPVTLKMPSGVNEFVDEYIHQNYKLKIKKQDVITRALLLAIYEIETGKELVKLDG